MSSTHEVQQVAPRVALILAPNPSEWTLDGTNTWIVGSPDSHERAVIDPGPIDEAHLQRIVDALDGRRLTQIWLTHSHGDHASSAGLLAERTGAMVFTARARAGQTSVADGELYSLGGVPMRVHGIPGHTLDSLGFELEEDGVVFPGDTLLGKGSSMVGPGLMGEMLTTLARLQALAVAGSGRGFPGHGPILEDLGAAAASRLAARVRRIEEVEALAQTGATVDQITAELYSHVTAATLQLPARLTVESILEYLRKRDHDVSIGAADR